MKRRPGPVPEEYWGCSRTCFNQLGHTRVWGQCDKALSPPCEHPAHSIAWDPGKFTVGCKDCGQEVTVQALAEQAREAISRGCICVGCLSHPAGECDGHCGAGQPLGWTLDPAKILAYVVAEQEGMRTGFSLMVSFRSDERDTLLLAAEKADLTPESFVKTATVRAVRRVLSIED